MCDLDETLKILKNKRAILYEDGLEIIGIFGSFANRTDTKLSDIDILCQSNGFFEKLKDNGDFEVLLRFEKDDLKGLNRLRNKIAHHHDAVIPEIIESVISEDFPKIKKICQNILGECF